MQVVDEDRMTLSEGEGERFSPFGPLGIPDRLLLEGRHIAGEGDLEELDVRDLLEYARAAVAVIRSLKITDRTMRYSHLARAIGLISDDGGWHVRHRRQITSILSIAAAVERQAGNPNTEPLEFERIVNEDGEPGAGVLKTSKIVRE